jgi:hypothetical protein
MMPKEDMDILKPMINDRRFPSTFIDKCPTYSFSTSLKEFVDERHLDRGKGVELIQGIHASTESFIPFLAFDVSLSTRFYSWKIQVYSKILSPYLMKKLKMSPPQFSKEELQECKEIDEFYRYLKKRYGEWYTLPTEKIKELYERWKKL